VQSGARVALGQCVPWFPKRQNSGYSAQSLVLPNARYQKRDMVQARTGSGHFEH